MWHINHCRLFNTKSSLYIYIKYIGFGLVRFYDTSTIVGYLMPNPLYTYILDIYDLVWLGFMTYHCRLFNAKSSLYIYIKYIGFGWVGFYDISTIVGYLMLNHLYHIDWIYDFVDNIFEWTWANFFCTQLNGSKYCYSSLTVQLNISHWFTRCSMIKQFYFKQLNLASVICLHSVRMPNISVSPIDRTLSGATTPGQSGHGSDGNEEVLCISQISREPHTHIV